MSSPAGEVSLYSDTNGLVTIGFAVSPDASPDDAYTPVLSYPLKDKVPEYMQKYVQGRDYSESAPTVKSHPVEGSFGRSSSVLYRYLKNLKPLAEETRTAYVDAVQKTALDFQRYNRAVKLQVIEASTTSRTGAVPTNSEIPILDTNLIEKSRYLAAQLEALSLSTFKLSEEMQSRLSDSSNYPRNYLPTDFKKKATKSEQDYLNAIETQGVMAQARSLKLFAEIMSIGDPEILPLNPSKVLSEQNTIQDGRMTVSPEVFFQVVRTLRLGKPSQYLWLTPDGHETRISNCEASYKELQSEWLSAMTLLGTDDGTSYPESWADFKKSQWTKSK